jgi:hypothetical protein
MDQAKPRNRRMQGPGQEADDDVGSSDMPIQNL